MTVLFYHRGGGLSLGYPPNALETFKWAAAYGAEGLELDVVLTAEGQIVVVEVDHIRGLGLDSSNLTWQALSEIEMGNSLVGPSRPVLLKDFIQEIDSINPSIALQVHLKGDGESLVKGAAEVIGDRENILITHFGVHMMALLKGHCPQFASGWLVMPDSSTGSEGTDDLSKAVEIGRDQLVHYSDQELEHLIEVALEQQVNTLILCGPRIKNEQQVDHIKAQGLEVGAWGVCTDLELAKQLIEYKLDRFTIDNPELIQ